MSLSIRLAGITLGGLGLVVAGCFRGDSDPVAGPVLTVETVYAGAGSQETATAVAVPIEKAIEGVEALARMRSRCGPGGAYALDVTLKPNADVERIQKLLRERLEQARSQLPNDVNRAGITLAQEAPGMVALVTLSPGAGKADVREIDSTVEARVAAELARLPGVASVSRFGRTETATQLMIDADRLEHLGVTTADIQRALEELKPVPSAARAPLAKGADASAGSGSSAKMFERLATIEQLLDLELRTRVDGRVIPLRMVALAQEILVKLRYAYVQGKPVVALGVGLKRGAHARELSAAIRDLTARMKGTLAPDVDIKVAMDFADLIESPSAPSTPRFFMLDLMVPETLLPERVVEELNGAEAAIRGVAGVEEVIVLSERPFDAVHDRPCILIRAGAGSAENDRVRALATAIQNRAKTNLTSMVFQVREISGSRGAVTMEIPFSLAVQGPRDGSYEALLRKAQQVIQALADCPGIADVMFPNAYAVKNAHFIEINAQAAKAKGVAWDDAFEALRQGPLNRLVPALVLSPGDATERRFRVERDRGPWMLPHQDGDKTYATRFEDSLKRVTVRGKGATPVPLADVVSVRRRSGPHILERLDGRPMIEIRASLGPGAKIEDVRRAAKRVIGEIPLPDGYSMTWLR